MEIQQMQNQNAAVIDQNDSSLANTSDEVTATASVVAKRKMVNYNDVSMAYLMSGMAGIERLQEDIGRPISEKVLWTAMELLEKASKDTGPLREYAVALWGGPSSKERGRAAPKVGDKRAYKVQQLEKGNQFLHLPVGPLGTLKGGKLEAEYLEDRIVIRHIS